MLFGLVAAYVIALGRQQKKLQDLSKHLEELITEIDQVFDKQGGRPSTDLLRKAYPLESDAAEDAEEKQHDDNKPDEGDKDTGRGSC